MTINCVVKTKQDAKVVLLPNVAVAENPEVLKSELLRIANVTGLPKRDLAMDCKL